MRKSKMFTNGQRVRCVCGDEDRLGLVEGQEYTVSCVLSDLLFSSEDVFTAIAKGKNIEIGDASLYVSFREPKLLIQEMEFPYFVDADRFEALS